MHLWKREKRTQAQRGEAMMPKEKTIINNNYCMLLNHNQIHISNIFSSLGLITWSKALIIRI